MKTKHIVAIAIALIFLFGGIVKTVYSDMKKDVRELRTDVKQNRQDLGNLQSEIVRLKFLNEGGGNYNMDKRIK